MKLFKAALLAASMIIPAAPFAHAATPGNALVVAQNIDDIVSIDPAEAYEFTSGEYVTQTYDRLVQYDAPDVKTLAPGLATAWTADDAAKTITFTLRDGVKFTSGNPLRAEDVVYSWKRVIALNKAPAFILAQLGWTPENYDKMVTASGNTVVVKYDGDFSSAFVLNVLAARPASIIDAVTVQGHATNGDMGNAWLKSNSAGTGPFVLKAFRPAEIINLAGNPNYFAGAPAMKSVIIRHVAEAATQQLLLESGDVDIAKNLTPDQIASLSTKGTVNVETYPQAAVHFLSLNQKDEALTNPAIWEAARYLVNYKGMTDSFLKGQMQVHQAFWPAGFPGSLDETPYAYDPAKAKKILADAGVKTPIKVTLDVINSTPFTDMAQSLQAGFAEAGINFNIIPGTGSQVITKYRARTHEAMLLYWGPDFMDPDSNAKAFAFNEDNSDGNYQSTTTWRNGWAVPAELNAATKAARAEADPSKRNQMYVDLQKQVQAKSPIIVMFQAATQVALAKTVSGYVNGATSDFVFYRLVKKN
ncbi:ABC transporter substrate-binding protein [Phyllobacterium myrsinacearum]|uniref:ABC transporter substrate-binding protein n=1 Tax=Phyllobacterium myrsinacearum TaxID=28101 RepID=A0A2S9JF48_9HYPH|nr:ABC transporter substrate-binding protein [Phyllobacterium myrsinacearum]PRD51562.1 ABC transporter substrate-binding protein [Phyllobacterium myrsinacearum]PWV89583.1 peptide/nickel transport system substrate-binding protein [Phyllobacterium myrsinacearum]RZU99826.1 peptide/nickel transport system substrate-binding protein [Phyllobacterium myrsinacearum]